MWTVRRWTFPFSLLWTLWTVCPIHRECGRKRDDRRSHSFSPTRTHPPRLSLLIALYGIRENCWKCCWVFCGFVVLVCYTVWGRIGVGCLAFMHRHIVWSAAIWQSLIHCNILLNIFLPFRNYTGYPLYHPFSICISITSTNWLTYMYSHFLVITLPNSLYWAQRKSALALG